MQLLKNCQVSTCEVVVSLFISTFHVWVVIGYNGCYETKRRHNEQRSGNQSDVYYMVSRVHYAAFPWTVNFLFSAILLISVPTAIPIAAATFSSVDMVGLALPDRILLK